LLVLFVGTKGPAWEGCSLPDVPWPIPTTNTSPIPDEGLRVLITYDEANRGNLPAGQKHIIEDTALRAWLDQHCVKNAKGVPEWRIWPDSTVTTETVLAKLMAIAKDKNEWLVVADGKRGLNEPLPADLETLNAKLTTFGGGK